MTRPLETGWLPDTPVDDSVLRRFVHNQAELNERIALACGGQAERIDDAFLADAGSAVDFLNQSILARPATEADDPVYDRIDRFVARTGNPSTLLSLWPTPDLAERGWHLYGHPMLVLRAPGAHPHSPPADVEVRLAADAAALATVEAILAEGYPIPEAVGLPAGSVLPEAVLRTGLAVRLGLLEGRPVGVASQFVAHGVNNLCLAATLDAARRRGVWQSLVWERVNAAADLPAIAFTSDYSRPGFLRMGFLPVARLTLWGRS